MYYILLIWGSLLQYRPVSGYAIEASNETASLEPPNIGKRQSIVTIQPISTVIVTQTPLATRSSSRTSITSSSTLSSSTSRTTSISTRRNSLFDQNGSFTGTVFTSSNTLSSGIPKSTTSNSFSQSTESANKASSSSGPDQAQLIAGSIGSVVALVTISFFFLIARKRIAQIFRGGNFRRKMTRFFKPIKSKADRARSTSWWSRIPLPKLGTTELSAGRQYTTTELPASNVQPVYELHASSIHRGIEYSGVPEREMYQRVEVPSPRFVAGELKLLNGDVTPRNLTDIEAASLAEISERIQQTDNHGEAESPTKETSPMLSSQDQEPEPNHSPTKTEITVTPEQPLLVPTKTKRRETLPPPPLPPRPTKRKKVPDADFRLTSPRGSTTLLTLDLPTSPINLSTPLIPSPIEPPEENAGPIGPPPIVPPRPARFRKKEVPVEAEKIEEEIIAFPIPPSRGIENTKAETPPQVPPKEEVFERKEISEILLPNERSHSTEEEIKPGSPPHSPPEETSSPNREPPSIPAKPEPEEEQTPVFSSNFSFSSPVFADPDISTQHVSMPPPSREAPISPTTTTFPHPISNEDTDVWSLNILVASTDSPRPQTQPPPPRSEPPHPPSSLGRRSKPILSDSELDTEIGERKVPHSSPPLSPSQLNNFIPLVPYTPPHNQPLNQNPPPLPPPSVSSYFPNTSQSSYRNTTQAYPAQQPTQSPRRNTTQASAPLISQIPENENSVPEGRARPDGSVRGSAPLRPRALARLAGAFAPVTYSPDYSADDKGDGVRRWVYR